MLTSFDKDALVYWAYFLAAEFGRPAPTCEQLSAMMDVGDGGPAITTTVLITQRLEKRGLIQVDRYQRARVVHIVSTGKSTAEPTCKTPHWRTMRAA